MLTIRVYADEVTALAEKIPVAIREAFRAQFESIQESLASGAFTGIPRRYLDPNQMQSGVTELGALLVGYLEYEDKEGVYPIFPINHAMLINKAKNFYAYAVFRHPYLHGATWIEQYLRSQTPWIEAELEAAYDNLVIE